MATAPQEVAVRTAPKGREVIVRVDVSGDDLHLHRAMPTWLLAVEEADRVLSAPATDVPLFRRIRKGGLVGAERLTPQGVAVVVRQAAARAGVPAERASPRLFRPAG